MNIKNKMFPNSAFQSASMQADVKVSHERPPNWNSVVGWLGFLPETAIFTYGDTIYNPSKAKLVDQIVVHEQVHMRQQNHNDTDAALWWGKFFRDPAFRIDQESEAYAAQYAWLCKYITAKQQRFDILMQLARIFAGPLYGFCLNYGEAMSKIRERSGVK